MLLKDSDIKVLAEEYSMISPFIPGMVKTGLSYGLGSSGYDIRLSSVEAGLVTSSREDNVLDPKNSNSILLDPLELLTDSTGSQYYLLPPNGVMLGVSVEKFNMPADVMAICATKSTYARVGVFANITPLEVSWFGYLTIEITNFNPHSSVKVYANEGIAQLLFFKTEGKPANSYAGRKYQDQPQRIVLSKAA